MKTSALIALARVLCILGLFTVGLSSAQAQIRDIATNATDPFDMDDSEPSIAVNPLNPLEIAIVTFSEQQWGMGLNAPVWKSIDGGLNWTKEFILPPPAASAFRPCDQKIQFDRNGNLIVVELACGVVIPRCVIFQQTGLDTDPLVPGAFFGDDQPMLDIDVNRSSPFLNRAYSGWLNFGLGPERSTVTWSPDLGGAVNNVTMGNAAFANRTTRTAVGPDGSVYAVFKTREGSVSADFENAHFVVKRSDDGGVTWNALGAGGVSVHGAPQMQTWFDSSWGNPAKGKVGRARSSDAWIATDPVDGDVYVVYCDRDASGFGQIFVTRSTNRGASWSPGVRITDGTHHSAFPEIAVACNGAIGVLYVDFDDSGANTIFRHNFSTSNDNGLIWANEMLQSMNPSLIPNASNGFLWGDYEGLTANGAFFYGVFTGQSIGRSTVQFDPIFFQRQAWTTLGLTCSGNISTNTDPDVCTALVNYPAPVITGDNCAIKSFIQTQGLPSGANFPLGVTTNTFVLTDQANSTLSCQFTVTVADAQLPTITCPANTTVSCDTSPSGAGSAIASDNCGAPIVQFWDMPAVGDCDWLCTFDRTWLVTDNALNTASCTQTITKSTLPLIEQALSADLNGDGKTDTLVLGTSNSKLSIPPGTGACILQWLPSPSTTPSGLTFKKSVVDPGDCRPGTNPQDVNQKLENALLAEALKLNLFVRLKPSLGTTKLNALGCNASIKPIILQALAPNPDVNELLRVTNAALGNIALQPHLVELLEALVCITGPLDICNL